MKKHFWLILAVLSILGMLIMPGTAHSAPIAARTVLPAINTPRTVLPNYPVPAVSIRQPHIQLPMPQFQPSLIPVSLSPVVSAAPVVAVSVAIAEAPIVIAPGAPRIVLPQSAIPSSRIAGISEQRKSGKGSNGIVSRIGKIKGAGKLAAMFDGAQQTQEPAAVPAAPVKESAPADSYEDTSLTLPESDLAEEIGLGY